MDEIKQAFQKVKTDIDFLFQELNNIKLELGKTRQEMVEICQILEQINEKIHEKPEKTTSTQPIAKPTIPTYPSTHDRSLEALKPQNMVFSTGNQGVPTDKQTDRQTDNKHEIELKTEEIMENSIDNAAKILDSLDSIKKEIRLKFKRLTEQEVLVFSTLYQIDEETGPTDYKTIAKKLGLTESSIRDYVGRLIKKGIPVDKKRINNKIIQLSISQNLKKIASLPTILQLRDI
jgi:DNA-binding MarR family transcriptional regulator